MKRIPLILFLLLLLATFGHTLQTANANTIPTYTKTIYPELDGHICKAGTSYFTSDYLSVSYVLTGECHTLMRFTLNSIPPGAKIVSATLYLYKKKHYSYMVGKSYKQIFFYRVPSYWNSEATWTKRTSTRYWVTGGGDGVYIGRSINVYASDPVGKQYAVDLTTLVTQWHDGTYNNYGIMLKAGTSWYGGVQFWSYEASDKSYRPRLVVKYQSAVDLTLSTSNVEVNQGQSVSLTVQVNAQYYSGGVSLSVLGLPAGASYSFNPSSGTPPFGSILTITISSSTPTGTYNIQVKAQGSADVSDTETLTLNVASGGDFSLSFDPSTITVSQGGSGSSTLTASFTGGFTGPITLSIQSKPAGFTVSVVASGNTATVTVSVASTVAPGTYNVVIRGSGGGKVHTATLTVQVEATGFSLAFNPASLTIKQGESGSSSLSLSPIGGFTDTVTLSVDSAPPGFNVEITPSSATPGSSVTVTVTVDQSVTPGNYNAVIKGESGGKTATATLSITVEEQPFDFNLQASPNSLSVEAGEQATITITATLTSGSAQEVTLTLSGLPSGTSYSFSPSSITPTSSSTLTIDTNNLEGSYSVIVTASGGGVSKQAVINLEVQAFDFTISANPTNLEMNQGESATIAITVTKTSGTAKKVKLSLLGLPGEASYSFDPEEVEPTGTSILTINAGSAKGTYTLIVNAEADGLKRTVTISLKINEKRCIIATVTYGSEVSREVNFLRGFRENIVLASYAGQRFYVAFDAFYYSWSPDVAQYILKNPWLKAPVKVLLYPLLASLLAASHIAMPIVHINPEAGVYLAGTVASALIGLFYLTPISLATIYVVKKSGRKLRSSRRILRAVLVLPIVILGAALVFQAFGANLAVTVTTSAYVISVIAASAATTTRIMVSHFFK